MSSGTPPVPPRKSRLRRWLFRLALVFVPLVLIFVVTEISLRMSGYGYDPRYFVPVEGAPGWLRANEKFAWRFMPRELARRPAAERLQMPKPPGTYRVFVLGSSAARGFPNSAFSVGRFLEVMLRARLPGRRIEVINTGVTAINSHVVRLIALECARLEPDAFVVYTGNNEVIGPFGPGTTLSAVRQNRTAIRFNSWLSEWRTGQWLVSLTQPSATTSAQRWRGLEMFQDNPVPATDPRLAAVYENYRANLTDIVEAGKSAGAKVVLCTVPANLRDCAPFGSAHRPGFGEKETADYQRDLDAARAAFREDRIDEASTAATALMERDPRFAETHFLLGRILWKKAFWDDSRTRFTSAVELDTIRFRAETGGNAVVRTVAKSAGASLADLEKSLAAAEKTPHGVPGRELFLDHVHLRFIGNYFAALAILQELQGVGPAPSSQECATALAYTPFDAAEDTLQAISIISRPPFTLRSNHEEELETLRREYAALMGEATKSDGLRTLRAQYEKVLAERPDDYWVLGNFAELLQKIGDRPAELAARERVVALRPEDVHARLRLATACWATDAPRAQRLLEEAERDLTPTPQTYKTLGDQFLANQQLEPAAARYREALRLWPEYPEAMQNLAAVLVRQQQPEEAAHLLERALKVQDDATSRHNLAGILARAGRHAEAVPHYERLVVLEPQNPTSHLQLGRALLHSGRLEAAEASLQTAEKLAPSPRVYIALGEVAERRGQWSEAEFRYRKALRLEAGSVAGQKLAWVLSTSPDIAARDPREAERLLKSLIAAAPGPSPELLDTMAACQAAQGRFGPAVEMARRAAQLATDGKMPELAAAIQQRLELYEKGQPYVQGAGK